MAIHDQLPIHKTGTDLLGLAVAIQAQMPRGFKRPLGDKITDHCSDMLNLMALANASKGEQRARCIQQLLTHNRAAMVFLRVALNVRAVNSTRWAEAVALLNSVGKQASGWLSKTREKAPAA